jgi:hypothetical protein
MITLGQFFHAVGLGVCFMVGVYLLIWFVTCWKKAAEIWDKTDRYEKMVMEYSKIANENRSIISEAKGIIEEFRKEHPAKKT